MDISVPVGLPPNLYFSIVHNFFVRKWAKREKIRKSDLRLQDTLLSYLKRDSQAIIDTYASRQLSIPESAQIPKTIWLVWWQGEAEMPPFIKLTTRHISQLEGFSTTIVSKDNVREFIEIDDILPLYEKKKIFIQHLSDVIRVRLLRKFGGIYMDASTVVVDPAWLMEQCGSRQFLTGHFTDFDPAVSVSAGKWSTYFWMTYPLNPLFEFLDDCLSSFILKHKGIFDYTQTDYSLRVGYDNVPFIKDMIDKVEPNNQDSWWINNGNIDTPYSANEWNRITSYTHYFKLSAKGVANKLESPVPGSNFEYILGNILNKPKG